jgi:hypothetical protein
LTGGKRDDSENFENMDKFTSKQFQTIKSSCQLHFYFPNIFKSVFLKVREKQKHIQFLRAVGNLGEPNKQQVSN